MSSEDIVVSFVWTSVIKANVTELSQNELNAVLLCVKLFIVYSWSPYCIFFLQVWLCEAISFHCYLRQLVFYHYCVIISPRVLGLPTFVNHSHFKWWIKVVQLWCSSLCNLLRPYSQGFVLLTPVEQDRERWATLPLSSLMITHYPFFFYSLHKLCECPIYNCKSKELNSIFQG